MIVTFGIIGFLCGAAAVHFAIDIIFAVRTCFLTCHIYLRNLEILKKGLGYTYYTQPNIVLNFPFIVMSSLKCVDL